MTINARHRKHYKAGSVWKPGEQEKAQERAASWVDRFLEWVLRRNPQLLGAFKDACSR